MGRIGLAPEHAADTIARVFNLPGIYVEGLMTHFADADLADKQVRLEADGAVLKRS